MRSQPGGSATAIYERQRALHGQRSRRAAPLVAGFALLGSVVIVGVLAAWPGLAAIVVTMFLTALATVFLVPAHVRAWRMGAEGEVATARHLSTLARDGWVVLHDRWAPGLAGNIDHVAIGPGGVLVVETKSYGGRVRSRREQLTVNGRPYPKVLAQAAGQHAAIQSVLAAHPSFRQIDVRSVICVHRAELPLFGLHIGGVPVLSGRRLVRYARGLPRTLTADEAAAVATHLDRNLPGAALG